MEQLGTVVSFHKYAPTARCCKRPYRSHILSTTDKRRNKFKFGVLRSVSSIPILKAVNEIVCKERSTVQLKHNKGVKYFKKYTKTAKSDMCYTRNRSRWKRNNFLWHPMMPSVSLCFCVNIESISYVLRKYVLVTTDRTWIKRQFITR